MDTKYNLIVCIVNSGFSENVMAVAKTAGARGGTILNARGTAKEEAEAMFNISIHPDKDMIYIIVPTKIRDNVLHALYENIGLQSEGQGIAFSIPIDNVVGLGDTDSKDKKND